MKSKLFAVALLLAATGKMPAFAQGSPLNVSYGPTSITVSGVSSKKGAAVVLVSLSRQGYYDHVLQISDSIPDDDRDGSVSIPMAKGIPLATVVVAVDEQNGDYVVSSPTGIVRQRQIAEPELRRDQSGHTAEIHYATTDMDVVVVRPGVGSWFSSAGGRQHIHADGSREVSAIVAVSAMKARGRADSAPDRLDPNDVLIVVDEQTHEVLVLREGR